jgi:hypothetical protein
MSASATRRSWRPLLAVPAVVALGLLARPLGFPGLLEKRPHELIAPPILCLVVGFCARRAMLDNDLFFAWLTGLAAVFLVREVHFTGSDPITGVGLVLLVVWAALRRRALLDALLAWRHAPWLYATVLCYLLSQLVARRAFKSLPGEKGLHVGLEELLETAAHLLFLLTAVLGNLRPRGEAAEEPAPAEPAAE